MDSPLSLVVANIVIETFKAIAKISLRYVVFLCYLNNHQPDIKFSVKRFQTILLHSRPSTAHCCIAMHEHLHNSPHNPAH